MHKDKSEAKDSHPRPKSGFISLICFYGLGVLSLIWLLIRSGSKPSRLAYPCQRSAAANVLGLLASHGIALPLGHGFAVSLMRGRTTSLLLVGVLFLLLPIGDSQPTSQVRASITSPAEQRSVGMLPAPDPNPTVAVITRDHEPDEAEVASMVAEALNGALGAAGMGNLVETGDTVLIKPNLGCGYEAHEITDWQVVKPVVQAAWVAGASQVLIGEGEGCGYGMNIFNLSGYTANITDVVYVDFNDIATNPIYNVTVDSGYWDEPVVIPQLYFDADVIITVPTIKTHNEAGVTISVKNAFGVPPVSAYSGGALYRVLLHTNYGIRTSIPQINLARKPDLAVVDAILAGEGQGPWYADPVVMNTILASTDLVALDTVGTVIMGIDPERIPYLTYAQYKNLGVMDLEAINIYGTPVEVIQREFALPAEAPLIYRKATVVEKTAQPLAIDALLGDWYSVEQLGLVDAGDIISGTADWSGVNDLSLTARFLYDQDALYAAVQVTDESKIGNPDPLTSPPIGELLELFLSLRDPWFRMEDPDYGDSDFHLGLGYGVTPHLWDLGRGHEIIDAQVALVDTPDGYIIELRIPFSALNGYTPVENEQFGLDFTITDMDSEQSGVTTMAWSGGLDLPTDARKMGVGLFGAQRGVYEAIPRIYLPLVHGAD